MLKQRIIQGAFGQHFYIHSNRDGAVPRSLKPLKFQSAQSARVFLQRLQVSEEYWRILASDAEEMAPFRGHQRDYLQVISNRILNGHLRIYEVQTPDSHLLSGNLTTLQDRKGNQYLFTPASYALTRAHKPLRFNTQEEIHQRLHDLAPTLDQLQSLVTALQLAPSPKSLTYTQLVDLLAEALEEEQITLYIQAPFNRTQNNTAFETSVLVPGNRPVPLAPPSKQDETPQQTEQQDTSPKSLDEVADLLKEKREEIIRDGYKQKYSDKELMAKAEKGEIKDRFLVRLIFGEESDARKSTIGFRRISGRAPYWSTTLDMAEAADTDPEIIAALFGIEDFDPKQTFTLAIIDLDKMPPKAERQSFIPKFEELKDFIDKEYTEREGFEPDTLDKIMTDEFSQEYVDFMGSFKQAGGNIYNPTQIKKYLASYTDDPKKRALLQARHQIQAEFGANPLYAGNGLTRISPDNRYTKEIGQVYGALEIFTFERDPLTIEDLESMGAVKLINATPIKGS